MQKTGVIQAIGRNYWPKSKPIVLLLKKDLDLTKKGLSLPYSMTWPEMQYRYFRNRWQDPVKKKRLRFKLR